MVRRNLMNIHNLNEWVNSLTGLLVSTYTLQ